MSGSPEQWYNSLGPITKGYLTGAFVTTCITSLGLISPEYLYLDFDLVWQKFQIWRLITTFLFLGGFSFNFLIKLYILTQYSSRLEANPFYSGGGPTADYAYMFLVAAPVLWIISFFFEFPFLGSSMIFMIVYVWSRKEPESVVSIWGFTLKGLYLPWALMAFTVLIGGSPIMDLLGVVAGHIYYFLLEVLPHSHQIDLIRTPEFLTKIWSSSEDFTSGNIAASHNQRPQASAGPRSHDWGTGRTLGSRS